MLRKLLISAAAVGVLGAVALIVAGCSRSSGDVASGNPSVARATEQDEEHAHQPGAHGEAEVVPTGVADEAQRQLYLTPGGLYTQADIAANGNVTGSQKFAAFQASHDLHPKVGEKICPVTLTKANPKCSWIVGGKSYEFCCPPCVDEFVKLAKSKPEDVKEPAHYVKQDTPAQSELK